MASPTTGVEGGTIVSVNSFARNQIIDGFGTSLMGVEGQQQWWQQLYFDDLRASILRVDLTPRFAEPFSSFAYNSPWAHGNPSLPGPDGNNVRAYENWNHYSDEYSGRQAPIAVMRADANENLELGLFDYEDARPRTGGLVAQAGQQRKGFKLVGSIWSPPPWVKGTSGNTFPEPQDWPEDAADPPTTGTPWPFIYGGNFAGGRPDTSDRTRSVFNDGTEDTSALTQFARTMASYVLGYQRTYGISFYAISVQNELNFQQFYDSAIYPNAADYIAALKALRAELDKYDELKRIRLIGPEDVMGPNNQGLTGQEPNPHRMWRAGGIDRNLRHVRAIEAEGDAEAAAALAFYCIHSYDGDTLHTESTLPTHWEWWANGWEVSPSPNTGIPANVNGFTTFHKKSWMTETSDEEAEWLSPDNSFPGNGGWSIALRIHRALTTGQQSAWLYWQLTNGHSIGVRTLTDSTLLANSPKYVAFKHFARYIRPNARRVAAVVNGASTLHASAYVHTANRSVTVVLINSATTDETVTVNLPSGLTPITRMRDFTSHSESLWQASSVAVRNNAVTVTVPGFGVTTLYGVRPR
jgi:O-glycosyl hydrolase